jgi:hypothetical protein
MHLVLPDGERELPARTRSEHLGPVVLHDLDVVDGDPDPAEELAPMEFHPVLLFLADLEREIYVQTHRGILPHAVLPPGDPDRGRRLRGRFFPQLNTGSVLDGALNLLGHGVGILEGKHVAAARQRDQAGARDGAQHLIGPGGGGEPIA